MANLKTNHDRTGLDHLDPSIHPARDAASFRRILAARNGLAAAEQELRDAVRAARQAGDSWTVMVPRSTSRGKPRNRGSATTDSSISGRCGRRSLHREGLPDQEDENPQHGVTRQGGGSVVAGIVAGPWIGRLAIPARRAVMKSVVFDLGGVVVVWDPVAPIAAVVGQQRAAHFVHGGEFDFAAWNHAQDAGRSWAEAEASATAANPHFAEEISAYRRNFTLSLPELVPGTAEILRALHGRGTRLVALTNWSAETFHYAPQRFPEVFALFDDVVVSGVEGVAKPDPAIFRILARRLGHPLDGVAFVDDSIGNVDAARAAGMDAVHFTGAPALLSELQGRALLD